MGDIGPLPDNWFYDSQGHTKMLPWFPLPSNLINKGEEWIPEVQLNATVCFPVLIRTKQFYERNNDYEKNLYKITRILLIHCSLI